MKIGMMGGWNTDSGAGLHTELIGRAWVEQRHKLTVFTFYDYAFHGTRITGRDEDYVRRCFTVEGFTPPELDPIPFLTGEHEIFVVQDLGMLPKDPLGKIFHRIRKRAKTVNVIHDGKLSNNPSFYQFEWDAIVCFDERYREFLIEAYDENKVYIIPYPCHPMVKGDKKAKRERLRLPGDKRIIFSFGPAAKFAVDLVDWIAELKEDYPIFILITTSNKETIERFREFQKRKVLDIELREETPDIGQLYDYLHASDLLIFNKPSVSHVVVSSTGFQCMGSGCPIVARDSNYVEYYDKEIMKYKTKEEFKRCVCSVFEETEEFKGMMRAAENYVVRNSASAIGKKYVELFNSLLGR